ncbi:DUF596 domain-containing protein [Hydrogenophaga sp.]|uniref:DUF596 domain-containing protein n=1 Tax=Hydrogenophaga sp. TaxID=1904254 RepID=UPI0027246E81|nr:DUF596 domain-containing protein [Hydrogenophaga sp.]MDO9436645.1 DUF596 domain-containing protein [Hydrogenophaga sp.]
MIEKMLSDAEYEMVTYYGGGRSLYALWDSWENSESQSFETRRDTFVWILERLLREGRIKLHKNGVFWNSPIDEQIETFRNGFPISERDADERCTKPGAEPAYEGVGMNVWWFLDICPAGVAWREVDGSYAIAD